MTCFHDNPLASDFFAINPSNPLGPSAAGIWSHTNPFCSSIRFQTLRHLFSTFPSSPLSSAMSSSSSSPLPLWHQVVLNLNHVLKTLLETSLQFQWFHMPPEELCKILYLEQWPHWETGITSWGLKCLFPLAFKFEFYLIYGRRRRRRRRWRRWWLAETFNTTNLSQNIHLKIKEVLSKWRKKKEYSKALN